MKKIIQVNWKEITLFEQKQEDYISLTDMVRTIENWSSLIEKWLRNKNTIEFLWVWEEINNIDFNYPEFEGIKNESWTNRFVLSVKQWIEKTNAIWIIAKTWRYGWTYAHKDIAFEFATWISPQFKLYLIKEFQRLKDEENEKKLLWWDTKRTIAKMNYKIQTDAIQKHLIPTLSEFKQKFAYADEADLLNLVIWWKTAKIWENENKELAKNWNMRDYSNVIDLVILANLENFNAEFIKKWLSKEERFEKLLEIARTQKQALLQESNKKNIKKLES